MAVEVTPEQMMYFRQPLVDKPQLGMTIRNWNNRPTVFRIKTTAPKRYTTKPHQGMVFPGESVAVLVTVVGFKQEPDLSTLTVKDKFLIQSVEVPVGQEMLPAGDIVGPIIQSNSKKFMNRAAREGGVAQQVHQKKLRVWFLPPEPQINTISEPTPEDGDQQVEGPGGAGVEEGVVLVDHNQVPSYPHDSSESSPDSPEALVDPRGIRRTGGFDDPTYFHEDSDGPTNPLNEVDLPAANKGSLQASLTGDSLRSRSSKPADPTGTNQTNGNPTLERDSNSFLGRAVPLLQQDVPLWTVIASVVATYTATRLLQL